MYKSSLLIAALVTGAYASENPFALEKNIQKIEQEESTLLQAIKKEQKSMDKEEDELFENNISDSNITNAKPEVDSTASETEIVQEPEIQEREKEIKKEVEVSKPEELAPAETKKMEAAVSPEDKVSKKPEIQEKITVVEKSSAEIATPPKEDTEKPVTIREITKKEVTKKEKTIVKEKPKAIKVQSPVEKKIEVVDEKIRKLEDKLEASEAKPASEDGVSIEANTSAEGNSTFDQKLQEAIKSVQD